MLPVQLWSASPTPLTADLKVDPRSVEKMIGAAIADGITGLFLGGSCGEGAWLPDRERVGLVRAATRAAGGKLAIAAQVSDNSVPRILDNIAQMAEAGAQYAIIAPPATMLNPTSERIAAMYEDAVAASSLPVGIYDLGARRSFSIPAERLKGIYLLPKVVLVKDSSAAPERRAIALAARAEKPALQLFNGDEFLFFDYLAAGYDGCLFGGAAAVAPFMQRVVALFRAGRIDEAKAMDRRMKETLFGIYGGENIACWLTGLKYFMVRRGLFASSASYLGYPLTEECKSFIEHYAAAGASI
jgi:4-hydroxy-tetrahydrodipicolinate synthase